MHRNLCEEKTTQLYLPQNASASRVWLVEPLLPGPPTITGWAVAGGPPAGILVVTLTPPDIAGYFAISSNTVKCAPAMGPTITVVGMGRGVGLQVRIGAVPPSISAQASTASEPLHLQPGPDSTPSPSPLLAQKKLDFEPAEHQMDMAYTCYASASNQAGAGTRSAPYTFTIPG